MEEIDYKVCKAIKLYNERTKEDPEIRNIANIINYSKEATRYHLKKLIQLGIIEKHPDKTYKLKVTNLK